MHFLKQRLQSSVYRTGLICLSISVILFCLPLFSAIKDEGSGFAFFIFNYIFTTLYFIVLLAGRASIPKEEKIDNIFLFLLLFFVSAWSLNREMSIFENSVPWFSALMILGCFNYLFFAYAGAFPRWLVHSMSFISGISLVIFSYLSLYLLPIYGFGLVGFFLLGVSLHAFVPLLFVIYTLILINKVTKSNKKYWFSFFSGFLVAITVIIIYAGLWNRSKNQINNVWKKSVYTNNIPDWVTATQHIKPGFFEKRILKGEIVYSVPDILTDGLFWRMPSRNFDEARKHDPLVMTAAFLSGKSLIDADNRIKILESILDMRHESQERLWSGDHLFTKQVNTDVKLWPACNIAYTEKKITVTNSNDKNTWRGQEEAIYTFYLPEGGAVTSLSLWINGKEEKGIMTTKKIADSAYNNIVGVQQRDPSIVHWQEGNTVSVRVFPVLAGESRIFKLGITAPLERNGKKLRYENINFKGPAFNRASEDVLFYFEQSATNLQMPASFISMRGQSYKRKGKYEPTWKMEIDDPGLSDCSFSFNKKTYSLVPYHKKLSPTSFDSIYLDINKSWTKEEFDIVSELLQGKNVFVHDSSIVNLHHENREKLWNRLYEKQFSLFPLYKLDRPEQSLIISKSTSFSPNIDDLENSDFIGKTKDFLKGGGKVKFFNLGNKLSPYLKSLKEFRVFCYDKGDIEDLKNLLTKEHFVDDTENDNEMIIHQADMIIKRENGESKSSGPDHLMRLFAYNHIMQNLGRDLLTERPLNDSLVQEARQAYVVSPVSSLVVLETKADYERFNISDEDMSLKNASLASKGAVPEPHEWILIIITLLTLTYIMKRKKSIYN